MHGIRLGLVGFSIRMCVVYDGGWEGMELIDQRGRIELAGCWTIGMEFFGIENG